jgi:hypothetical protein
MTQAVIRPALPHRDCAHRFPKQTELLSLGSLLRKSVRRQRMAEDADLRVAASRQLLRIGRSLFAALRDGLILDVPATMAGTLHIRRVKLWARARTPQRPGIPYVAAAQEYRLPAPRRRRWRPTAMHAIGQNSVDANRCQPNLVRTRDRWQMR